LPLLKLRKRRNLMELQIFLVGFSNRMLQLLLQEKVSREQFNQKKTKYLRSRKKLQLSNQKRKSLPHSKMMNNLKFPRALMNHSYQKGQIFELRRKLIDRDRKNRERR
jgi:hypothetical protein